MNTALPDDERWMRRALEMAARGRGRVEPNPPVGAVIVRNGKVLGEGWHERFGGPHAEVRAIESAGHSCRAATLYVTLEPCTGRNKKTPPCSGAVVAAGVRRIVIGARDPTQAPAIPELEAAGIEVTTGVLERPCRRLIAPFLMLRQQGRPWVIAKWAMTADGRTATVTGDSKWITSDTSRELVHRWRNEVDAILVGAETVRRDDPRLTCRIAEGRNPQRIVVDSNATLALESNLVKSIADAPVTLACLESAPAERCATLSEAGVRILRCPERNGRVDLKDLLRRLGAEQVTHLLVEGGAQVIGDLLDSGHVDEVRVFVAPLLFGGADAPGGIAGRGVQSVCDGVALEAPSWRRVGPDILLTADVARGADAPRR